jgi:probable phosphoglycerate mutase
VNLRPGITIYFLRHGETDWNRAARTQGQTDIPLNDRGRLQARQNGRRLAALIADPASLAFLASPLERATETMEIVRAEIGLARNGYSIDPRLQEISFGVQEGRSWPGYVAELMRRREADGLDPWRHTPPGGESYAAVRERACKVLEGLERDTVVVAHGGICRCLHAALGLTDEIGALNMVIPHDRVMLLAAGTARWH